MSVYCNICYNRISDEKSARTYLNNVATRLKDDVDTLKNNFAALNCVRNNSSCDGRANYFNVFMHIRGKKVGGPLGQASERRWNCWKNNWS